MYLNNNQIGDNGAIAIGNNPTWMKLKELSLHINRIGDEGAISIVSNIRWTNLEELLIFNNVFDGNNSILWNSAKPNIKYLTHFIYNIKPILQAQTKAGLNVTQICLCSKQLTDEDVFILDRSRLASLEVVIL